VGHRIRLSGTRSMHVWLAWTHCDTIALTVLREWVSMRLFAKNKL